MYKNLKSSVIDFFWLIRQRMRHRYFVFVFLCHESQPFYLCSLMLYSLNTIHFWDPECQNKEQPRAFPYFFLVCIQCLFWVAILAFSHPVDVTSNISFISSTLAARRLHSNRWCLLSERLRQRHAASYVWCANTHVYVTRHKRPCLCLSQP